MGGYYIPLPCCQARGDRDRDREKRGYWDEQVIEFVLGGSPQKL